jgi:hypothetical protein
MQGGRNKYFLAHSNVGTQQMLNYDRFIRNNTNLDNVLFHGYIIHLPNCRFA